MKRTVPAVSFTPSHRAFMFKMNKPLLGAAMHHRERYRAAWDDIPLNMWFDPDMTRTWNWDTKCRFQLGLRNDVWRTKLGIINYFVLQFVMAYHGFQLCFIPVYTAIYGMDSYDNDTLMGRKHGTEDGIRRGYKLFCADGKFAVPTYHMHPPQFTMTTDDM